jgi:hypothetical protein
MKIPLVIAHGEQVLYFIGGVLLLLFISVALVVSGVILRMRKTEEGKALAGRLISVGGLGLVAVAACGVYMFI